MLCVWRVGREVSLIAKPEPYGAGPAQCWLPTASRAYACALACHPLSPPQRRILDSSARDIRARPPPRPTNQQTKTGGLQSITRHRFIDVITAPQLCPLKMTTDVISVNCPPLQEAESVSLSKRRRLCEDYSDVDTNAGDGETNAGDGETNAGGRPRRRRKILKRRRPKAPINTTQFLMNDMKSISPTSDWERFNQSDSDTEEYEQKEFTKDYAKESSRYGEMYRHDLIKEYLSLEKTVSSIERQYTALHTRGRALHCDNDVLEKIRIFQQEIHKIKAENLDLSTENSRLRAEKLATHSDSSNDSSSSDSDSSSSSSDSDESCSDSSSDDEEVDKKLDDNPKDDTGYESDTNLEVSSST